MLKKLDHRDWREELEDVYFASGFDGSRFFQGAYNALDAISNFWDGLEADRLHGVVD